MLFHSAVPVHRLVRPAIGAAFFVFLENPHVLLSKKHMPFPKHLVIISDFWNCSHIFPTGVLYSFVDFKRKEAAVCAEKVTAAWENTWCSII